MQNAKQRVDDEQGTHSKEHGISKLTQSDGEKSVYYFNCKDKKLILSIHDIIYLYYSYLLLAAINFSVPSYFIFSPFLSRSSSCSTRTGPVDAS